MRAVTFPHQYFCLRAMLQPCSLLRLALCELAAAQKATANAKGAASSGACLDVPCNKEIDQHTRSAPFANVHGHALASSTLVDSRLLCS